MSKALATKNVAAVLVASVLALGFAFSFATPAKADATSDLQAQVTALLAQITALQGGSSSTMMSPACHTFTRNHKAGNVGGEVMWIQQFLNSMSDTMVAVSGAGSKGNESSRFGPATKAAVMKFQMKYKADILTPVGLTKGTGTWGPSTRAKANALCAGMQPGNSGNSNGGGTTPTPTGTGLTISAGTQPVNSLAPEGASRVPFTTFTLTNNSGAAVTVTGVTVQRTGLANDIAFSGVVLVDSNGLQVGVSRTFNSNHQAVIGDTMTIAAGASMTFTVAGNIGIGTGSSGQVASIAVVGINTTATVSGLLPITGASQTLNNTLTLGNVTANVSTFDPNGSQSKNIGDTAVKFAGVRFTAGSAEDVKLYSIRFRQSGTVGSSDLANVMIVLDGTSYPATWSADGKYITAVFPGGVLIQKGYSKDVYVQGDIVGSNIQGRTIQFDIDKASDVYFVGQLYGYGVSVITVSAAVPTTTGTTITLITAQPWFDGSLFTLTGVQVTSITKANEVAAQNVSVNVPNQPLGGFVTDLKGEGIQVQRMVFTVATTGTATGLLTNVSIVNESGVVVAGPVDGVGFPQTLTFTDTVTFPAGRHVYTLKGKLPSTFLNNSTVQLQTVNTAWTNVLGVVSGNNVTLPTFTATLNQMTVKSAQVALSVNPSLPVKNVVQGVSGFLAGSIRFDASNSGEDVKFANAQFNYTDAMTVDPTNCQAYDGTVRLTTTAPASLAAGLISFVFDTNLIVAKGTVKTVDIKCDVPSNATPTNTFSWGLASSTFTGIGVNSSNTVTPTFTIAAGPVMTVVGAGTLTVSLDALSPATILATGATNDVVASVLRFNATNEPITLDRVALTLGSSTAASVSAVKLYDGNTLVGSGVFTGTTALVTLTSPVVIPADSYKTLTVKVDISAIGPNQSGVEGAFIRVDHDALASILTRGSGASSGTQINDTSTADTTSNGVIAHRSIPQFAKIALPSSTLTTGSQDVYRFSIAADNKGDVAINAVSVDNAVSGATVTAGSLKVYAYSDAAFSTIAPGTNPDGSVKLAGSAVNATTTVTFDAPLTVPAGQSRYFKVVEVVTAAAAGNSISTRVTGDAAFAAPAAAAGAGNFVWSGNKGATPSTVATIDWNNGFNIVGLPASGTDVSVLSKN